MSSAIFSQQTKPSPTLAKQDYLLKSKKQKTAAWILIGGGFVLSSAGVIAAVIEANKDIWRSIDPGDDKEPSNVPDILFYSGNVVMLSSIPLFIVASKNKRKAMRVSLKNETTLKVQKSSFAYRPVPSLSLTIRL